MQNFIETDCEMSVSWVDIGFFGVSLVAAETVRFGGMEVPQADLMQAIFGSILSSGFSAGFRLFGPGTLTWKSAIANWFLGVLAGVALANLLVLSPIFGEEALVSLSVLLSLGSAKLARRWISSDEAFDALFKKIWPGK